MDNYLSIITSIIAALVAFLLGVIATITMAIKNSKGWKYIFFGIAASIFVSISVIGIFMLGQSIYQGIVKSTKSKVNSIVVF